MPDIRKRREILSAWKRLRAASGRWNMSAMTARLALPAALLVAALAGCASTKGTTAVGRSFKHLQVLHNAVVYIRECGTGWLASDKYIVTNYHVVACLLQRNKKFATVDFSDGTTMKAFFAAQSNEPYVDLAVLALDGQVDYEILEIAPTDTVPKDTLLLSVGNPSPVTWVPTTYRVVMQPEHVEGGLSRVLILEGLAMYGNSGSPVVGMDGKVVGTIFARAPGFAYAVPVQPYLVTLLRTVSPRRTWP
jgi:S1-C subfamily serine protease